MEKGHLVNGPAQLMNSNNITDAVPPSWDSACQWGGWALQTDNWTLTYRREQYEIDLETCNTSAELLDWIFQIESKSWATPQVLSDLLCAFSDIFDPQANLCSGGASRRINASSYLRKRYGRSRPKAPAKAKPMGAQLDAREFLDAVMAHPVGATFSLWNLQGDIGIRLSCMRRNKFPAQLDFRTEIALAKKLGWIKELDEDLDFTEKEQRLSGCGPIRYGASFVRTASSSVVKAQREKFIGELAAAQGSNDIAVASNI